MGGTDTTQTTQSQQENQLPPWINTAAQQNYGFAQNVATQPLQQYQGQMVAGVSPQTQQSWNTAAQGGNAGQGQYNAAQAGYLGVLGQQPMNVTASQAALAAPTNAASAGAAQQAGLAAPVTAQQAATSQLANTNLSQYMNPYTQSVINATLPIMQQNLGLSQNQQQNAANSAGAFGGSRQAIQQGVTQAQGAMGMGEMAAQLNQANFAQAQAAGEFDVGQANQMGQFNAGQANQVGLANMGAANAQAQFNAGQGNQQQQFNAAQANQVGLANMAAANQMGQFNTGAQNTAALANQAVQQNQGTLNLQASAGLGGLGNAAQAQQLQNFGEQTAAGGMEQQQAQNEINANMAAFQQANQYPYQQLSLLQSALGMTPYETAQQGQSTTQTQSSPNYLQAATSGLQMLGSVFSPTGALGALNPYGSDRRLKTDITKIGRHPSGINIHAYRYKGDPKSYPKVVGPMAEDVAKKFGPAAVAKIPGSGGKMAVHPAVMGALAAPISRRPMGLTPGPARGAGPVGSPPPGFNMGPPVAGPRGMPTPSLRGGMGPPVPGALSGPGVAGGIGALGAAMRPPPALRARRPRMGSVRGALGV
jgi:hypothetical protein